VSDGVGATITKSVMSNPKFFKLFHYELSL